MTTLDRGKAKRSGVWLFGITILLLAAVAATLGYLVFGPDRAGVDQGDVRLSVAAVSSIKSGEQLDITIEYENLLSSEIEVGTMEVLYPAGFYVRSADPKPVDQDSNTWHINSIPSGTGGSYNAFRTASRTER